MKKTIKKIKNLTNLYINQFLMNNLFILLFNLSLFILTNLFTTQIIYSPCFLVSTLIFVELLLNDFKPFIN